MLFPVLLVSNSNCSLATSMLKTAMTLWAPKFAHWCSTSLGDNPFAQVVELAFCHIHQTRACEHSTSNVMFLPLALCQYSHFKVCENNLVDLSWKPWKSEKVRVFNGFLWWIDSISGWFKPWETHGKKEPEPRGDVLDLLYDVVRKPPVADKASATHCLVAAALIKLVTRCPGESEKIKTLGESQWGYLVAHPT